MTAASAKINIGIGIRHILLNNESGVRKRQYQWRGPACNVSWRRLMWPAAWRGWHGVISAISAACGI